MHIKTKHQEQGIFICNNHDLLYISVFSTIFNNTGNETDLAEREYVHTRNKFTVTMFYCNDKLICRSVVPGLKKIGLTFWDLQCLPN